jgi:hypothetical protein
MIPKPSSRGHELLPTIMCSWCKRVLRIGAPKVSHGICRPCAATFFARHLPAPIVLPS